MFAYNSSAYSRVVDFSSATLFESNGVGNVPVALANPAADNFALSSASSCRDIGISGTGVTVDYIDNIFGVQPDAGAYVFIN